MSHVVLGYVIVTIILNLCGIFYSLNNRKEEDAIGIFMCMVVVIWGFISLVMMLS